MTEQEHEPWMDQAVVTAVWARPGESPERIAQRIDLMVQRIGEELPLDDWELPVPPPRQPVPWPGGPAGAELLRAGGPSDEVNEAARELFGFSFSLAAQTNQLGLHAMISAGGSHPGYRTPLHVCLVDFLPMDVGMLVPEDGDAVLSACVEAWEPLFATLSSAQLNRIARRGGWRLPPGYRVWVSDELGPVTRAAEGVQAQRFGAGTLLWADDELAPERVVACMLDTFRLNGLDEVPH